MRPFTGQITTKGLPPHTYCVRSPRGIKQPVFYSWTRWQNFSVFLGHHILQASGGESTNQAHTVEVGMGLPTRGGIYNWWDHGRKITLLLKLHRLQKSWAKPATVITRLSRTQVLQSVCEDVLESGEKRSLCRPSFKYSMLAIPDCWKDPRWSP